MDSQARPGDSLERPGWFSNLQPEILPPGGPAPKGPHDDRFQATGYGEPGYRDQTSTSPFGPPPPPPQRRKWAFAPATYVLLAINLAVFLPMFLSSGFNNWALEWGSNFGDAEIGYGQWWRVLTSTFIHNGPLHVATNMWCLWNLGLLGEPLLGPWGLVAVYVLTGIGGSLLSTAVHIHIFSVGASGAIFGLAGVLIMLLNSPLLPVPRAELQRLRRSVIWFAALNFLIGGGISFANANVNWLAHSRLQIDNMAHLGGFLSGLAVGAPLLPRVGAPREAVRMRQQVAFAGGAFLLLLLGYGIFRYNS
ncbi:MAG TPA: rhomboid family intramembrane serine protease [Acidisarcina sp.]